MKVLGNIDVDLDVVNKDYVDGEIGKIDFKESFTKNEADKYFQPKGNYLTSIPSQYVTSTELSSKNYTTMAEVEKKGYLTEGTVRTAIQPFYVSKMDLGEMGIPSIWKGTENQYNSIYRKDPNTIYIIEE